MIVVRTIAELRAARREVSGTVSFVPTMGALHAGHRSLIQYARDHSGDAEPTTPGQRPGFFADRVGHGEAGALRRRGGSDATSVVVSIFVNPTQFAPTEDFTRYPRPLEDDLAICKAAGAAIVFAPEVETIYPPDSPKVEIDLPDLTTVLEGAHRAGHFAGVCQVVAKLFNLVQPDIAVFGRKDFQQLRVIEAMVQSLDWPIRIVGCPTVRDPDGLAMSSRNRYLSADERTQALSISRGLREAEHRVRDGERSTETVLARIASSITASELIIDYVAAIDPATLKNVETFNQPTVIAVAAKVGKTRLIDNVMIEPTR